MRALAILGSASAPVIYAGTDVGVFRSQDEGATFSPASSGLGSFNVVGLLADPPSRLYAMTIVGLFESGNGGRSWSAAGEVAAGPMTVSPASGTLYVGGRGEVARSSDAGKTWKTLSLKPESPVHQH